MKVSGTAKSMSHSGGIRAPKAIPSAVDSCQQPHSVRPQPRKYQWRRSGSACS